MSHPSPTDTTAMIAKAITDLWACVVAERLDDELVERRLSEPLRLLLERPVDLLIGRLRGRERDSDLGLHRDDLLERGYRRQVVANEAVVHDQEHRPGSQEEPAVDEGEPKANGRAQRHVQMR